MCKKEKVSKGVSILSSNRYHRREEEKGQLTERMERFLAKTIALVGTLDTKGEEIRYIKGLIESIGLNVLTVHSGVFWPKFTPDINNTEVAKIVGKDMDQIVEARDPSYAIEVMTKGIKVLLPKLYDEGKLDGVLSLGGTNGTSIATPGMRALPIGVPKVMVSTVASGNTLPYVGNSDIIMIPSIVDFSGLNRVSTLIYNNAVFAITGMLQHEHPRELDYKPLIAASTYGLTTPSIEYARKYLEKKGFEVLVFQATGTGGKTMERLIENGFFAGVLDLTTTELADEVVGGVLTAGPDRLEAAGKQSVPQVISVGGIDMVNFGPKETIPEKFTHRRFYQHNPNATLMRTTPEENKQIAQTMAEKINQARGHTTVMFPLRGFSDLDMEGHIFHHPKADQLFMDALKEKLDSSKIEIVDVDAHLNDKEFAEAAAEKLLQLIEQKKKAKSN